MKKLYKTLVVASVALIGANQASASTLEEKEVQPPVDVVIVEDLSTDLEDGIAPHDTIERNNTQTKTTRSMWGDLRMTVTYDRNPTTEKSTITGIETITNTDSNLTYHDSFYSAGRAEVVYYNQWDKVYVRVIITASECK